ncbi:hypothetical protein [Mycobacteroides abscessus]|uniref:hypothetical protein n=1 Tax=Mycobacteroides abscessus TaxID=36809 RepID=UPI000925D3F6|nr:hypothetical protein [Mycobacteroides abscessus]SIC19920.1 Uncharacterised protein [Mycobacteroides abscessus subsp. abscessus]
MYQPPQTPAEYEALVQCKYDSTEGWALTDHHGTVVAWHRRIPGDIHWDRDIDAARQFIPDSRLRAHRQRLGWRLSADDGALLTKYLEHLRNGTSPQHHGENQ